MTAQETAIAEARRVCDAIYALGGTASIQQITDHLGWAKITVQRRLVSCGPLQFQHGKCYFVQDRGRGTWGLSVLGREQVGKA